MKDQIPKIGLHERVAEILRQEIDRSERGHRLEPIATLSKRFAVSVNTVRDALLLLAKEGLVELKHGRGSYVRDPAERQHVGILIELDISHPGTSYFRQRVIQQLRGLFEDEGYRTKLYLGRLQPGEPPGEPTYPEFLEDVKQHKLCGVAAVATIPNAQWMDVLQARRVPVVGSAVDYEFGVDANPAERVREGARRLLERGRRKLALMSWAAPWQAGETEKFLKVFRAVLAEFGATAYDEWIRHDLHPSWAGAGWAEFREVWTARNEKPDGLVISDDVLFPGAASAILGLGLKVPEQLMVVTHAVKGSGMSCPFPVTCLEHDPDEYARATAALLIQRMRGEAVAAKKVPFTFRWREIAAADARPGEAAVDAGVTASSRGSQ